MIRDQLKVQVNFSADIRSEKDVFRSTQSIRGLMKFVQMSEIECCSIQTSVSELATNILRYAESGKILIELVTEDEHFFVSVAAIDEGPGIESIELAMKDNYSTDSSSLGVGLPAVRRLMDEFSIESKVGVGTLVRARKKLGKILCRAD